MTTVAPGDTISGVGTLHVIDCPTCGCIYAIPAGVYRRGIARKGHATIYCPNGHTWHFTGKTHEAEVRDLRDSLAQAHARRDQAEADARMARAREAKARKERDRIKTRAGAGVCPCCNRTFAQLARHIKSKHPDYAKEEHA